MAVYDFLSDYFHLLNHIPETNNSSFFYSFFSAKKEKHLNEKKSLPPKRRSSVEEDVKINVTEKSQRMGKQLSTFLPFISFYAAYNFSRNMNFF